MSVVTFDGVNKLIICNSGTTELSVQIELYSDWKEWVRTDSNAKYEQAFSTTGGDALSLTLNLGDYYFLENGWKIRPYEGNHVLTVTGNLFTRDGLSPFVSTVGSYNVSIRSNYASLTQTTAGGGTTANDIWNSQLEGSVTAKQLMRLLSSVLVGKTDISATGDSATVIFRDINDTVDRITATMSGSERTNLVTNVS